MTRTLWLILALGLASAAALTALPACGSDGTTPKCSELTLYAADAATDADLAARAKAAENNCVTLPGEPGDAGSGTD